MKRKHTATPWKRSSEINGDEYATVILGGQYNGIVAHTSANAYFDFDDAEANAAHIVKCVNSHDELVSTLERVVKFFDNHIQASDDKYESAMVLQCKSILKKLNTTNNDKAKTI